MTVQGYRSGSAKSPCTAASARMVQPIRQFRHCSIAADWFLRLGAFSERHEGHEFVTIART